MGLPRTLPRMSHKRDVDCAHAFDRGAAAAHVGEAAKDLVPELLDARPDLRRPARRRSACGIERSARDLPILVVVVISPQPVMPSSVFTSTNRNSPQYEAARL